RAENDRSGSCEGTVTVCVPLDQAHPACVDRDTAFDSTGPTCSAGCGDICLIGRSLTAASCPGEPMPHPVKRRLAAARRALRHALRRGGNPTRATRLVGRAMTLLDAAERLTLAGESAGTISPHCASQLSDAISDTDARTLQWLQAITTAQ